MYNKTSAGATSCLIEFRENRPRICREVDHYKGHQFRTAHLWLFAYWDNNRIASGRSPTWHSMSQSMRPVTHVMPIPLAIMLILYICIYTKIISTGLRELEFHTAGYSAVSDLLVLLVDYSSFRDITLTGKREGAA